MRFKFDANQEHQTPAIEAVVDLFQGQGRISSGMTFALSGSSTLAAPFAEPERS